MKHITRNTLLHITLIASIFTGSALFAMDLCKDPALDDAWENIQLALDNGAFKYAERCKEIKDLIASHSPLYPQCVKYMAQEHLQLLRCELWLLKTSLDYCKTHPNDYATLKPQNSAEIDYLKGLTEALEEKEERISDSIDRLTKKKADAEHEIVLRPNIAHMFKENITKFGAKIARRNTQLDLAQAIKKDISALLQEAEAHETAQPAQEVVSLLLKQASYDTSIHQQH